MTAPAGASLSIERPFPGLRPYSFADHEFFFGREDQVYALYRLLDFSRFIAVIGSSGSGKSSLVRAGLHPLLQTESLEAGGRSWRWVELRPGDAPLSCLADALAKSFPEEDDAVGRAVSAARRERIAHALQRSSFGVAEALEEIAGTGTSEKQSIFLVVDQFEELFRYAGPGAGRRDPRAEAHWREETTHFVQLLLEAGRDRAHGVHVLITMRSDFIGDCARFHGLPEAVSATQYLVPSLTRDQREEVIRRPIEAAGASIEPALVERLLNDCSDDLDQLPVLQHCLMRLWDQAGASPESEAGTANRHLTLEHYRAVGGMAAALSDHADKIMASLPGLELAVEQTFRALAEIDHEGRATRRALAFDRLLAETGVAEDELRRVLDRFRADDCSFLVPSLSAVEALLPGTRIDVGHEALLRRWERISAEPGQSIEAGVLQGGWLWAEERDRRLYRALLALAADTEGTSGRVTLPLEQVEARWKWWRSRPRTEAWAERYGGGFDQVRKLLEDSRAALQEAREAQRREAEREARRKELEEQAARQRLFQAAAAICLLLFVLAAGAAIYARNQESKAQLAAEAARNAADAARNNSLVAIDSMLTSVNQLSKNLSSGGISVGVAREILDDTSRIMGKLTEIHWTPEILKRQIELLLTISDIYVNLGGTKLALQRAREAKGLAETLAGETNDGADAQHYLSEAYSRIGHELAAQDDWLAALPNARTALDIAGRLASRYPDNRDWQSALALQHTLYADLLLHDDPEGALREYKTGLQIRERLASGDATNTVWRRDVAASHARIGDVLAGRNDVNGALAEHRTALEIRRQLAEKNPDNAVARANLSTSHNRIGDLLARNRDPAGALGEYRIGLDIRERLAADDPSNASRQSALAFNHVYVGDALAALNDLDGALQEYRTALTARVQLAKKDPDNAGWQNNLATSHNKIASVLRRKEDLNGVLQEYRAALEVQERFVARLAASALENPKMLVNWEARQFASREKIGDTLAEMHELDGALQEYRAMLVLAEELAVKDPADGRWRKKADETRRKIGSLCGQTPAPAACSA